MSKIILSKAITRTYNLGDYENYKPTVSVTKEYDDSSKMDISRELDEMTKILDNELAKDKAKLWR